MPNNQIEKGYDFTTGQLVTADNLDNLAQEATLKKGAISEQPAQTDPVASTDELLIHDVSDTGATKPKKATVAQLLQSNVPIIADSITSTSNFSINTVDGAVVTATGYTYVSGNIVTVASPSHGLAQGDYIELTCVSTSGDTGSKFSGRYRVNTIIDVNSFTYKVFGVVAASNGTCTWKKVANLVTNGNEYIDDDLYVGKDAYIGGKLKVLGDKSILLPKGDTASRPSNPESGEIRYNSTLNRAEVYDGTTWKELGAAPFEASGGNFVLAPSNTAVSATFTSANGIDFTVTVAAGHDICMGQIVEIVVSNPTYTAYNGEYIAISIPNQFDVVLKRLGTAAATASGQVCTIRKSGNHKVHVFRSSGNFVVGENDGECDILIVGGGAHNGGDGSLYGGGSGGILDKKSVKFTKNSTYAVTVGLLGPTAASNGGRSSITGAGFPSDGYWADGGKGPTFTGDPWWSSGASGGNSEGEVGINGVSFDWGNPDTRIAGSSFVDRASMKMMLDGSTNYLYFYTSAVGYISTITNIPYMYAAGGLMRRPAAWDVRPAKTTDLMHSMNSPVSNRGFSTDMDIGINGINIGRGKGYEELGGDGIVIIRYPYKLQT